VPLKRAFLTDREEQWRKKKNKGQEGEPPIKRNLGGGHSLVRGTWKGKKKKNTKGVRPDTLAILRLEGNNRHHKGGETLEEKVENNTEKGGRKG